MKTLVIYDGLGVIFSSPITGGYIKPEGTLNFLEIEIPTDKILIRVNTKVTPNVPIFEDIPLSETEILREKVAEQEAALIELATIIGGGK